MDLYIKRSGEDGRRGWKEGRRSAEGRSGKGPDVFPVGEERRGEDGKEEGGIESRGDSQQLPCNACCIHTVVFCI